MKVSTEQLLQIIGELYVENKMLTVRNNAQALGIQSHMEQEHPQPVKEEE